MIPDGAASFVDAGGDPGQKSTNSSNANGNEKSRASSELRSVPKKQLQQPARRKSSPGGTQTAADLYEPGFRIINARLCTEHTRLLVLITSAAVPAHAAHRQAIRMTWMARYGRSVAFAFLLGTPKVTVNDKSVVAGKRLRKREAKREDWPAAVIAAASSSADHQPAVMREKRANSQKDVAENGDYADDDDDDDESADTAAAELNAEELDIQKAVVAEHRKYGDIVQTRVRDVYSNLTLKSIAGLEWTRDHCPMARYLLKTDDDMFIDVRRLLRFIDKVEHEAAGKTNKAAAADDDAGAKRRPLPELPPTIWGRLARSWRPIRTPSSKYFVSKAQFVGRVFPDFCTGPAYLMTRSTVVPLYEGALGRDYELERAAGNGDDVDGGETPLPREPVAPYLKLEDVYLTGVVAERLGRRAAELERRDRERREREKARLAAELGVVVEDDNGVAAAAGKEVAAVADAADGGGGETTVAATVAVRIKRLDDPQFANRRLKGRELERAICADSSQQHPTKPAASSSWGFWDSEPKAAADNKNPSKRDSGVLAVHMVQFHEQFELWRRLWDTRIKCGAAGPAPKSKGKT